MLSLCCYTRDKLREANLFSVVYSSKYLLSRKRELLVEDPCWLYAKKKKKVKSDILLSFRELSLIHWFLLSLTQQNIHFTPFFVPRFIYITRHAGSRAGLRHHRYPKGTWV